MRWMVVGLLAVSACASSNESPDSPDSPDSAAIDVVDAATSTTATSTAATPASPVQPTGFETRAAIVTTAEGETCDVCVWLAETATQRRRGLMYATDLGPADAMAFRWQSPHTGTFWMRNTPLPLSIAFFDPDGSFMSSFDMEPCSTVSCPNYATPADFLVAVEVPRGGLDDLGIGPGATLDLLDAPCT